MSKWVLPLDKVGVADAPRVGEKAAALGALIAAGFPVPPGLCLTTDAFHLAFGPHEGDIGKVLHAHDLRNPSEAAIAAQRISDLLTDLTLPSLVTKALANALPVLAPASTLVAVRSSATVEDRADSSYAGQYATVLGVRGQPAIYEAILACWRSLFSAHALVAQAAHRTVARDEAMAVLIQPMIDAECAGVCFSVDPVREQGDLAVISASWGLGMGVVDGSVATDTAWVHRDGFTIEKHQVVEKQERLALGEEGVERLPVGPERRSVASLPNAWLVRVAEFAVAIELLRGQPQDIEWAIAAHQLYILQSRPIPSLPRALTQALQFPVTWDNPEEERCLWRLGYSQGGEHGMLLPLERDEIGQVERVREEACCFMGADRNQRMKICNGRIYFTPAPLPISEVERRVRQQAMEDLTQRLHRQGLTAWEYWGPEIIRATKRLAAFAVNEADALSLATHLEEVLAVRRRHFMLHPLCSFDPSPSYFEAFEKVSGLTGEAGRQAAYRLLEGEETMLTKIIEDLYALAQSARAVPMVASLIADPPPDVVDCLAALPEAASFHQQFAAFLELYGERTGSGWGSEATVRTPTWRENPADILKLVAFYLDPSIELPADTRQRVRQARHEEAEALCEGCHDPALAAEFRRELAYARHVATVLEEHNHYIDQLSTGQLRRAVMAAASWLVEHCILAAPMEILWLTFDEIVSALRAETPAPLAATIADRQAEHRVWQQMVAPPILGVPDPGLPERPAQQQVDALPEGSLETGHLRGIGASPGRYRGRARVSSPTMALPAVEPGDVLVAENVGPRWTPLFPLLGGLILDQGSLGQHAAATAREYGVPAVIATQHATRRIPDGCWVVLDGVTGTVEVETQPEDEAAEDFNIGMPASSPI